MLDSYICGSSHDMTRFRNERVVGLDMWLVAEHDHYHVLVNKQEFPFIRVFACVICVRKIIIGETNPNHSCDSEHGYLQLIMGSVKIASCLTCLAVVATLVFVHLH